MDGEERRIHPRRPFRRELFCYIDGARFDARSEDISLGGMFVGTSAGGAIPIGALVALVVKEGDLGASVFLFGRVVRRQLEPVPGLGLVWERAVASGAPDHLLMFLTRVFDIRSPELHIRSATGRGFSRYVYEFPQGTPTGRPEPPATAAPEGPAQQAPDEPDPGALTVAIERRRARTPCRLDVLLAFEGLSVPAVVRSIGTTALFVETRVGPTATGAPTDVHLEIATGQETARVVLECRVTDWARGTEGAAPGLDLEIVGCREGNEPGVFNRLLRFLHFRSMAAQ
jgi:hypothetical protein